MTTKFKNGDFVSVSTKPERPCPAFSGLYGIVIDSNYTPGAVAMLYLLHLQNSERAWYYEEELESEI